MKRFTSIKAVKAVGILSLLLTFSALSQAQTVLTPCCTDFDDNSLHGYGPCPLAPNVGVVLQPGGPPPSNFYLHATDLSGGSSICAGPDCLGDWSPVAASGCGALCFDVRLFDDAGIPGGQIPPSIYIFNSTVGATFVVTNPANITVDGLWHHYCAPIGFESGGVLPSNSYGHWEMRSPATPADWNGLIANVTRIQLPIDWYANPAEQAGYDNICLRTDECPPGQIPTLTEWGMIIFAVLLASWMTYVVIRRWRRSQVTAA